MDDRPAKYQRILSLEHKKANEQYFCNRPPEENCVNVVSGNMIGCPLGRRSAGTESL